MLNICSFSQHNTKSKLYFFTWYSRFVRGWFSPYHRRRKLVTPLITMQVHSKASGWDQSYNRSTSVTPPCKLLNKKTLSQHSSQDSDHITTEGGRLERGDDVPFPRCNSSGVDGGTRTSCNGTSTEDNRRDQSMCEGNGALKYYVSCIKLRSACTSDF